MNITDIQRVEVAGDKLEAIFKRQGELEHKYKDIERNNGAHVPAIPLDIDSFGGQERIRLLIYRISEELFEAGNCLRNKAWKVTQMPTDKDHFLEELSDALHFLIQLYLELGLSPDDMASLYFRKAIVNSFRQESKY